MVYVSESKGGRTCLCSGAQEPRDAHMVESCGAHQSLRDE